MANLNVDKLLTELENKWGNKFCPMCNKGSWVISDKIFELREYKDGDFIIGGGSQIQPVVPITCEVCGNTIMVNPLVLDCVEGK